MDILIRVAQLLVSLSLLIVIHEFGHFMWARLFGTRVEKFYMFFDTKFSIFRCKRLSDGKMHFKFFAPNVPDAYETIESVDANGKKKTTYKPIDLNTLPEDDWRRSDATEYGLGWLPFGGYVKIAGMIDESMDEAQMSLPAKPDEFRSKKPWQRLLVMVGGVLNNLIMAVIIYTGILYVWGEEYLPTENLKYGVVCDSTALAAGLQNGDKILTIDGQKVDKATGIAAYIVLNGARTIQVERNGVNVEISLTDSVIKPILDGAAFVSPRFPFIAGGFAEESAAKVAGVEVGDRIVGIDTIETPFFDQFRAVVGNYKDTTVNLLIERNGARQALQVAIPSTGMIGVAASTDNLFELRHVEYGLLESIPAGIKKSYAVAADYLKQFKLLVRPETKAYESLGGFIAIGKIFPTEWHWQTFWSLTGFFSIMLAVLNILPIPALDGGHVMFTLYEIITRRKPSDKFLEYAQMIGLALLFALLIYANGNDIVKLFR